MTAPPLVGCVVWSQERAGHTIYTATCNYLGNTICNDDPNVIIDNVINDMNRRLNHLLAEFSHCDSGTLSIIAVH